MKVMIVTTPIRPTPSGFPPFGSLALIKNLRKAEFNDVEFYDIDGNRPAFENVIEYIGEARPDILGISAVVSTAYEYCKRLSLAVKEILPDTFIVLGGNMGASANVLLRKTGIDIVVLGEGERAFANIARLARKTHTPADFKDIKGLMLLDETGTLINTGYETPLPADQLYDIDWDDLEKASDMDRYIRPHDEKADAGWIQYSSHAEDSRWRGKRIGLLYASKGCVSRCTFCHRWDKGIRFIPVPIVMQRLDEIIERFNVGFLQLADENFGTNKRWLKEFCAEIKKRNIIWRVGTRAKGMSPDIIGMMRDAGCASIIYGNETGSERMLQIMEKKISIDDNYNAVKWAIEAGLGSKVQLVLGMPGESTETVKETIEFCKFTNSILPYQNPNDLSINYAQALPGTPLYEYARAQGLIGRGIAGEEEYLLQISDRDAHDEYTTLNFTDYPKLICETWRPLITVTVNKHYVEKFGLDQYHKVLYRDTDHFRNKSESGYFANPKRIMETSGTGTLNDSEEFEMPSLAKMVLKGQWGLALISYPDMAYRMRKFLVLQVLIKDLKDYGLAHTAGLLREYLSFRISRLIKPYAFKQEYRSLRKIIGNDIESLPGDSEAMGALRKGR
ncbi:MAG TPA: radical SAM protein [Rhodospirillales bacterium]|nr:radical SAM protein [Rhodospirillales bacterium]